MDSDFCDSLVMPQLVVLAGGFGSRLGRLAENVPKALVEVVGKPVLGHILDWAGSQGCDRALVLTGHLGHLFDGFQHPSFKLTFQRERFPLGTGGALWNSKHLLEERFILVWGDDLHQIDYRELLDSHISTGKELTMTVTTSYEPFNLEHRGGVVVRYDKSRVEPGGLNGYEAGTSVVERSLLESHGKEKGKWSWEEVIYPSISGSITAHLDDSPFWDMGTPEGLGRLVQFLDGS